MASRKEAKEQARLRRVAEEQARAAQQARTRRIQMLAGVVVAAVAIVAVLVAVSSGSSGGGGLKHGSKATATVTTVSSLLNGIPESGTTLGSPSAPVTMTYYGDLECPVCAAFTTGAENGGLSQLISNEVKQGKVKVVYRSSCTATCNDASQSIFTTQQTAAYAAGLQGRFWYYAELFYREQGAEGSGYVNQSFLDGLAEQVPELNLKQWQANLKNPSLVSQVNVDEQAGVSQAPQGTPTLIFSGPKGKSSLGAGVQPYSALVAGYKSVV